jgi:hypothetical protein
MNNKKEDKPMEVEVKKEYPGDPRYQISLKQLHNYTDALVERGHAEYNKTSVLVRSKHPLDECLRRGIIEEQHHDSGKRIMTIRDCAFSMTSGRIYNASGEGDSGIDAMTLFVNTERVMRRLGIPGRRGRPWDLVKLVCFAEPDIDGNFFGEADYAMLYQLGPNIQNAFEELDKAVAEARQTITKRFEERMKSDSTV